MNKFYFVFALIIAGLFLSDYNCENRTGDRCTLGVPNPIETTAEKIAVNLN